MSTPRSAPIWLPWATCRPRNVKPSFSIPISLLPAAEALRWQGDAANGGEDGALLGALEHTDLPYVGGGVGASAAAMNKATGKAVFRAAGIEVNPDIVVGRREYGEDSAAVLRRAQDEVGLPCFVKPISLGSSIGVSRCQTREELEDAFELGLELDVAVLVEPALDEAIEINCAVLGRAQGELTASACEQPVKALSAGLRSDGPYLIEVAV